MTETIGFLYGDDDDRDPRRVSATSNARSSIYSDRSADGEDVTSPHRSTFRQKSLPESKVPEIRTPESSNIRPLLQPARSYSFEKTNGNSHSPNMTPLRDQSPSETAQTQFPLNDIDYESSPAAVAQELSNLQALRRMSMDVHAAGDPDLPSLNPAAMPTAPSPTSSEDDAARLFWVPARLHPELAPKEFKTFLESKAEQIKRRSGDLSSFTSSPMSSRSTSLSSDDGNLRRKKSMLSREINSSLGYQDGAERLERKRSESHDYQTSDPNLAELESLVAKNIHVQRPESPDENADFVLPAGASSGLKRSRATTHGRKPAGARARGGDRSQRGRRIQTPDQENRPSTAPSTPSIPPLPSSFLSSDSGSLADTLSFSSSKPSPSSPNFSRLTAQPPSTSQEPEKTTIPSITFDSILSGSSPNDRSSTQSVSEARTPRKPVIQSERQPVPRIVETPPKEESSIRKVSSDVQPQLQPGQTRHPERTSSRDNPVKTGPVSRPPMPRTHSSVSVVSTKSSRADVPPISEPKQSLEQPSPLPGNDTNTSNLSFIPTLTVDKQSQEKKESKKSSWSWGSLLGKDEEKEKAKGKVGRSPQSHDNTRLDVLQTSIEGSSRRRETIELDRDSLRLEEERKKESQRKAPSSDKKEKKGFISSLFGREHKAEREAKKASRGLSPEPPYRELKPDIDYNWTRFSILEERAIYRMAHIKLANPRRALYSQVLLSNFMYSYLAKVQQMHPQMNLPTSAKQQKKQKEQKEQSQQSQQSEEFNTYQRYQQVCNVSVQE